MSHADLEIEHRYESSGKPEEVDWVAVIKEIEAEKNGQSDEDRG